MTLMRAPKVLSLNSPGVDTPISVYVPIPPGGPPETRFRDPLHAHLQDTGAVEQHVTLPAGWVAIRDRWAQLVGQTAPCRNKLTTAVLTGQGDIPSLGAQALAEESATPETMAVMLRPVAAAVHAELVKLYQPVAAKVYAAIRRLFDDIAGQHDDSELDQFLPVLLAAARLCGADPDVAPYTTSRLGVVLSIDPKKAHQRRLVEAWATPTRWEKVRGLGAEVRANPDPLAPPWQLPDPIRCVDADRRLRWWDPLDGPLPKGWQGNVEGWLAASPALGAH
ncbi:hypothetical protein [Mycobacterium marinum]|uniref:hypothetical protein n=1 Tax=Mycobacterium marinum TaxID=1781 RepID=UPI0023593D0E|nr:hypothetical protein [Mycobacterium marinum]MDC9015126.1 hypothetical protein [Mycobacterium marinum]